MDKREVLEKLRRFSEIVVEKYNPLKTHHGQKMMTPPSSIAITTQ